jgi:hypothetical protein
LVSAFPDSTSFLHGKAKRPRSFPEPQGASRSGTETKSKNEAPAARTREEEFPKYASHDSLLDRQCHARASVSSHREDREGTFNQA